MLLKKEISSNKQILEARIKRKRQILFSKEDDTFIALNALIDKAEKEAVIRWALELAELALPILKERYPDSDKAENAIKLSKLWADKEIKMPIAKKAILECHKESKNITNLADKARYHAIGQACSTVHAKGHALGFPLYALTAIIRENDLDNCDTLIEEQIAFYIARLQYWIEYTTKEEN